MPRLPSSCICAKSVKCYWIRMVALFTTAFHWHGWLQQGQGKGESGPISFFFPSLLGRDRLKARQDWYSKLPSDGSSIAYVQVFMNLIPVPNWYSAFLLAISAKKLGTKVSSCSFGWSQKDWAHRHDGTLLCHCLYFSYSVSKPRNSASRALNQAPFKIKFLLKTTPEEYVLVTLWCC